jgi:hypothetical protein
MWIKEKKQNKTKQSLWICKRRSNTNSTNDFWKVVVESCGWTSDNTHYLVIFIVGKPQLITLHSSPVGQLTKKSSFHWKKLFNTYQSKASIDIVYIFLGEKVVIWLVIQTGLFKVFYNDHMTTRIAMWVDPRVMSWE